jgi:restriction system protein
MKRNPQSPWNPGVPTDITPVAFERLVREWLQKCDADVDDQFQAEHLGIAHGQGGDYKIDVLATLTVFGGARVIVLAECKHLSRPVERDSVMVLHAKLQDVGAHKGMLFSTSGFQKGAIQYAQAHGIASVTVVPGEFLFETRAFGMENIKPPTYAKFDTYAGMLMTSRDGGIGSRTIELSRVDALMDFLSEDATLE